MHRHRLRSLTTLIALAAAGCSPAGQPPMPVDNAAEGGGAEEGGGAAEGGERLPGAAGAGWVVEPTSGGTRLVYSASAGPVVELVCPRATRELIVRVMGFTPVGSEDRLTLGSGSDAVVLVATPGTGRGVTASGDRPDDLGGLLGGAVSINHGSQNLGPITGPPPGIAQAFAAACGRAGEVLPATAPVPEVPTAAAPAPAVAAPGVSACRLQDGAMLPANAVRAIGTEPFWAATIDGRCVTYSHPDDQVGTRVWTRFAASRNGGGTWTGALRGKPFVLRSRPQPGCSDGMSDRLYSVAVDLTVGGEQRSGCAAPL